MLKPIVIGAAAALLLAVPAFAACTPITSKTVKLTGCVDSEWVAGAGSGAQEFVYLTADQNFGLQVITESETVPAQQFHDAIIANAVKAIGGAAADVKIVGERIENVDGKPFNVLEYTIPNDGNPVLFQNFYYSQPGFGSVQILGYSLETDGNTAAYKTGVFTSTVKIGG
jgi:hypothetical protein